MKMSDLGSSTLKLALGPQLLKISLNQTFGQRMMKSLTIFQLSQISWNLSFIIEESISFRLPMGKKELSQGWFI